MNSKRLIDIIFLVNIVSVALLFYVLNTKCDCKDTKATETELQSAPLLKRFEKKPRTNSPGEPVFCAYEKVSYGIPAQLYTFLRMSEQVHVVVVNTEYESQEVSYWVNAIANSSSDRIIHLTKYNKMYLDEIKWMPEQDFGYGLTQIVLNSILGISHFDAVPDFFREKCTHILMTNSDNLYVDTIFTQVKKEIEYGTEIIGWLFTSHHHNFEHLTVPKEFRFGEMDLGSGLASVNILKRLSNHFVDFSQPPNDRQFYHAADGHFWEKLSILTDRKRILHNILFVHQ